MLCTVCEKRPVVAKGLCSACYTRKQRTGSTDYRRKGRITYCSVDGCDQVAHAQKLCFMHYQRKRKHGHTDSTRPETWGEINAHPLVDQWNWLHHRKGVELCAPEWRTDFRRFVSDVGERPGPKFRLKPIDKTKLIGPGNFAWVEPEFERREGETQQEAENRAERGRRAMHPDKFKQYDTRKKYNGLSLAGVAAMAERQDHRCAICREKEGTVIRGQVITLAVDHDHETGVIRGLLCVKCNRGLGLFRDSQQFLQAAIDYLANPPGEVLPRVPIKRRKPRTKLQPGTANNDLDDQPDS